MESPPPPVDRGRVLDELVRAEQLEQSIQARYTGYKRFSLEGLTALVPFLTTLIDGAGEHGAEQALVAVSHRGRLSVMTQVVGRQPLEIFAGFEEVDPRSVLGSGDVKYHLGATGTLTTPTGRQVAHHLNSNPSHLEVVFPVAMGRMRAKLERLKDLVEEVLVPAHAAFLKTGTGVHGGPLAPERIARLRTMLPPFVGLKVSGGIRTREAALAALAAGADVLGMSRTFEILKESAL